MTIKLIARLRISSIDYLLKPSIELLRFMDFINPKLNNIQVIHVENRSP